MLFMIRLFLYRLIDVCSFLLLVYALLSWFPGAYQTRLGCLINQLVEPILKPFRNLALQFGGLDFTVWFVMIALNFLKRLL